METRGVLCHANFLQAEAAGTSLLCRPSPILAEKRLKTTKTGETPGWLALTRHTSQQPNRHQSTDHFMHHPTHAPNLCNMTGIASAWPRNEAPIRGTTQKFFILWLLCSHFWLFLSRPFRGDHSSSHASVDVFSGSNVACQSLSSPPFRAGDATPRNRDCRGMCQAPQTRAQCRATHSKTL